jgi:hypothetical protein
MMDRLDKLKVIQKLVTNDIQKEVPRWKTPWESLNKILSGGIPKGRLIEVFGPSQIGKTTMGLNITHETPILMLDADRKMTDNYIREATKPDDITILQKINNDPMFNLIESLARTGIMVVIDSLPMIGDHIGDNRKRFRWLGKRFGRLQRTIIGTDTTVVVLNGIRQKPSTGEVYNAHEGCLDPSIKIKMHLAERRGMNRLVYIDIVKDYWAGEDNRCTLLVTKNGIEER